MSIVQTAPPDSDESSRDEDDSPDGDPCPHCPDGFLSAETDDDDEIERVYCPVCHLDPEGSLDLPEVGDVPTGYEYPWESYDEYRVSKRVMMRGVYPAYHGNDSYDTNDDSASYDEFVS